MLDRSKRHLKSKPSKDYDQIDTELDQAKVRILVQSVVLIYMLACIASNAALFPAELFAFLGAMLALACLFYWNIKTRPGCYPARRILTSFADNFAITYVLAGSELTMFIFPIYLWVTLGNGFRYGTKYLFISQAFSIAGLVVLMQYSTFESYKTLVPVFIATLVFIPLYATRLIKRLFHALEKAREGSAAKTRFVSNISHEIRTPLNGIVGISEILTHGHFTDSEYKKLCANLVSSAHSLMRLLNDVLDMAKIESGKLDIIKSDFDLHRLVEDVVRIFAYEASSKGLELKIAIDSPVPRYCVGATKQLQQILMNLIGNAVKFTEKGGVSVTVNLIKIEENANVLRFKIKDTGIGIPESHLDTVFERFAQINQEKTNKNVGTGLGTTIAKQLVEALGGVIGVASREGAGSTFWCDLPFELGDKEKVNGITQPTLASQIDKPDEARMHLKILVAEDNVVNQFVMRKILDDAGFTYRLVEDGEKALDALIGDNYDIAILDMLMPNMSGIDVCRAYKASRIEDKNLEFVMLSANVQQEDIETAAKVGFCASLPKPVDFVQLVRLLDEKAARKRVSTNNIEIMDS
jgi:two-component system sensor histidine kinase RpfC